MEKLRKGIDFIGVSVCCLCHDGKGNVVMNFRSTECRDEHHRWDICTGGVELHDTIEATIRKEVKEELKTDVLEYEFMGFRDVHREQNGQKTHWVALDFKVLVDREKVGNGEDHKFEKVEWFPMNQWPTPLHSQLPAYFEKNKLFLF
jgi:8-oxo-dGTP pyrophosphatase MutT (NUDIX family)